MEFKIKPLGSFIYRTPLLPTQVLTKASEFNITTEYLDFILRDPNVLEAIYISSKDFYSQVELFLSDKSSFAKSGERFLKFATTALSYLDRMSMRAAPFGLMAGCGFGVFNIESKEIPPFEIHIKRQIEIDNDYLFYISDYLESIPEIKNRIIYYPNNTLYEFDNEYKYIEFFDKNLINRIYNVASTKVNEFLTKILKFVENGKTYCEIVRYLISKCS
jgi:hypothetical protein